MKTGNGDRCRDHAPLMPQARRHVINITRANLYRVISGLKIETALTQQVQFKHIMLMPERAVIGLQRTAVVENLRRPTQSADYPRGGVINVMEEQLIAQVKVPGIRLGWR